MKTYLQNLEVANVTSQPVLANSTVYLGNIIRRYCCNHTFSYNQNVNSITLNNSGYYVVNVHATITGALGNATLVLSVNGVAQPQTLTTESITTADTQYRNMAFSTIVRVLPNSPLTLNILNGDTAINMENVDMEIIKIC